MTTKTGSTPVDLDAIPPPVPFLACVGGAALQVAGLLAVWSQTSAGPCLASPADCIRNEGDPWGRLVVGAITVSAFIWAVSLRTDTHSDASIVDRLWSIQPWVYCWYVCFMFPSSARVVLMTALATAWGVRLTHNFAIKGGYSGGEDYRWAVVRHWYPGWRYEVVHLVFVCGFQQLLLLAIAAPAVAAAQHPSPLNAGDALAALVFVGALALEAVADRQQFAFQTAKYSGRISTKGFIDSGVWAYSRHPNYFAEVLLWWAFYGFAVAATGELNWSGAGAVCLTMLFAAPGASADLTELLSSKKYPAYAEYQKRVSRLVPWIPSEERPEVLGPVARAAYLLYFASHIPITLLIDAQAALDHRYFPECAQALLDWHIRINGDNLMGAPPSWFRSVVWAEICLQLPFFFVAVKALYDRDEAAFRIPFIVYGAHVATTMIPILGEICGSTRLALIYLPYLLFPLGCVVLFSFA
jgi:steroid 5-alpha reductase family enzyme